MRVVCYREDDVHFDGYWFSDALVVVVPEHCTVTGPYITTLQYPLEGSLASGNYHGFRVTVDSDVPRRVEEGPNYQEIATPLIVHMQEPQPRGLGGSLQFNSWGSTIPFLLTRNAKRWSIRWHQPGGMRFKVSLAGCLLDYDTVVTQNLPSTPEPHRGRTAWDHIRDSEAEEVNQEDDLEDLIRDPED